MIEIIDHQSDWAEQFSQIKSHLHKGLESLALSVDHIGSTSISGLCAKDVIDIQITVAELDHKVAEALTVLGFQQRPDIHTDHIPPGADLSPGSWSKMFFRQPAGQRRMNIHVRIRGNPNQRYPLLFRDFLRTHPHYAAAYGRLKRQLSISLTDEEAYSDVKDPAVDLIYFAAQEWAKRTNWQTT